MDRELGDYPIGANTSDAPWNQKDLPEKEINVKVSITLSTTCKIKVSDYTITDSGVDEDGNYYEDVDYSNCDLESATNAQLSLKEDLTCLNLLNNTNHKGWIKEDIEITMI